MYLQIGLLLISIVGLYFGAEFALDSGERIGKKLGLSSLVIGLLIIGFGTSLPELFVSHLACLRGEYEIALGNVIGSNIANSFLVIGICALFGALSLKAHSLRKQVFYLLFVHLFLLVGVLFFGIGKIVGVVYLLFFIYYLYGTLKSESEDKDDKEEEEHVHVTWVDYLKLLAGFSLLYFSGELLVTSGSELGRIAGISTYVISAIFVAFGTSFPELITGVLSCIKKKDSDLIVGNIIGSNIFNLALVLGSVAFYPISETGTYLVESIVLIIFCLLLLFLVFKKSAIGKFLGITFLLTYLGMNVFWIMK